MNHLQRDLAPISPAGWRVIETEAAATLKTTLAARQVVDFVGPMGWTASAVECGRSEPIAPPIPLDIEARVRWVLPLVEMRVLFDIRRSELEAIDRGAPDMEPGPIIDAARKIAIAEDHAVFHGYRGTDIRGISEAQAAEAVALNDTPEAYPLVIATAITKLRDAGIGGPYGVVLGKRCYAQLTEATVNGYPVLEHVRRLVDGPLIWSPGLTGAVVLSMRGGDFEITVGQDFSIGYLDHDAQRVRLYIEESFAFRLLSPQAAIPLVYP
jgi:uncharacterized linocin/CFP29 family protein